MKPKRVVVHKLSFPHCMRVADCNVDAEGKTNYRRTWRGVTCKNCLRTRKDKGAWQKTMVKPRHNIGYYNY